MGNDDETKEIPYFWNKRGPKITLPQLSSALPVYEHVNSPDSSISFIIHLREGTIQWNCLNCWAIPNAIKLSRILLDSSWIPDNWNKTSDKTWNIIWNEEIKISSFSTHMQFGFIIFARLLSFFRIISFFIILFLFIWTGVRCENFTKNENFR